MGQVCLVKTKKQKNVWSATVLGYYVMFIFVDASREMGSDREMKLKWFQGRL